MSSKNKCSSIFSYTPLFAIRVAWIYCIYDLHHLQIAVHELVNQHYMADSIVFYRKCLFPAAVRKRKNDHDLGKTPLQRMIEWRKFGANPTNQTPIRPFSHPINATDLGAATESYEKKRSRVRIEMKKKEPLIQHLPPSTRTDLNRTSISRYTFVPHMEWYSQVQPKFGLQMPTTETTTPTAVSPIFWLAVVMANWRVPWDICRRAESGEMESKNNEFASNLTYGKKGRVVVLPVWWSDL